jgi:hypothetical protein
VMKPSDELVDDFEGDDGPKYRGHIERTTWGRGAWLRGRCSELLREATGQKKEGFSENAGGWDRRCGGRTVIRALIESNENTEVALWTAHNKVGALLTGAGS